MNIPLNLTDLTNLLQNKTIKQQIRFLKYNELTLKRIRYAYDNDYIIFVYVPERKSLFRKVILLGKLVRKLPTQFHNHIVIWFTPESEKQFKTRITKALEAAEESFRASIL